MKGRLGSTKHVMHLLIRASPGDISIRSKTMRLSCDLCQTNGSTAILDTSEILVIKHRYQGGYFSESRPCTGSVRSCCICNYLPEDSRFGYRVGLGRYIGSAGASLLAVAYFGKFKAPVC